MTNELQTIARDVRACAGEVAVGKTSGLSYTLEALADKLDELQALAQDPDKLPNAQQGIALARLIRDFNANEVALSNDPPELPSGYVGGTLTRTNEGFSLDFGIAPNGDVST